MKKTELTYDEASLIVDTFNLDYDKLTISGDYIGVLADRTLYQLASSYNENPLYEKMTNTTPLQSFLNLKKNSIDHEEFQSKLAGLLNNSVWHSRKAPCLRIRKKYKIKKINFLKEKTARQIVAEITKRFYGKSKNAHKPFTRIQIILENHPQNKKTYKRQTSKQ